MNIGGDQNAPIRQGIFSNDAKKKSCKIEKKKERSWQKKRGKKNEVQKKKKNFWRQKEGQKRVGQKKKGQKTVRRPEKKGRASEKKNKQAAWGSSRFKESKKEKGCLCNHTQSPSNCHNPSPTNERSPELLFISEIKSYLTRLESTTKELLRKTKKNSKKIKKISRPYDYVFPHVPASKISRHKGWVDSKSMNSGAVTRESPKREPNLSSEFISDIKKLTMEEEMSQREEEMSQREEKNECHSGGTINLCDISNDDFLMFDP